MTMSKVSDHKDKASLSPQSSLSFAHPRSDLGLKARLE